MSVALSIAKLAARILPEHRRDWGDAMAAEVAAIENPLCASLFAAGCLWAALSERITLMKAFVFVGRVGVGIVTALYGSMFIRFMISALLHGRPTVDFPYPWLLIWQAAMGLSHVTAGLFLIFWRPKAFRNACIAAALSGLPLVLFGLIFTALGRVTDNTMVISWAWPFVPLTMLIGAAWLFAWLEQAPKRSAVA